MRLRPIVLVACVAVAAIACGIDAVGTMPSDAPLDASTSSTSSSTSSGSASGSTSSSGEPATDAGADVEPVADATVDAVDEAGDAAPPLRVLDITSSLAPATFNISGGGFSEWAYWGVGGSTQSLRKAGAQTISGLTPANNTSDGATASGFGTTFSWTDATNGSGSSDGYVYSAGSAGSSFSFTVPAGPTKKTLVLFVGGSQMRGRLSVDFVDGASSMNKNDSSYESQSSTFGARYDIDFRTVTVTTLNVKWEVLTAYGVNSARVAVAALR